MSQFIAWREMSVISPTWSINSANISGINSYRPLCQLFIAYYCNATSHTVANDSYYNLVEHLTFYPTGYVSARHNSNAPQFKPNVYTAVQILVTILSALF